MMPPEAVLGYISDLPEEGSCAEWFAEARHALAPRLLIPLQNPQKQHWILGNFSKSVDLHQIETQNQLQLVLPTGNQQHSRLRFSPGARIFVGIRRWCFPSAVWATYDLFR
jgi:hypothetical protein